MSLYEGAKTRVRVDSELSEEFEAKAVILQRSVLSPFLFAVVVDVVIELDRDGVLCDLLYADDLALMSETIGGLRNKFFEWMEAFESKDLKINFGKMKVIVSSSIMKDGMSNCKVDPC